MHALGRPSTTIPLVLSATLIPLAVLLAFLWTGDDVDQGFSQKIFYLHVPVAFAQIGPVSSTSVPKMVPEWTPTYERRSQASSRFHRYSAAQTAP